MQHDVLSPFDWPRTVPCAEVAPARAMARGDVIQRHIQFPSAHASPPVGHACLVAVLGGDGAVVGGAGRLSPIHLAPGQVALIEPAAVTRWTLSGWHDVVHLHLTGTAPTRGAAGLGLSVLPGRNGPLFQLVLLLLAETSPEGELNLLALIRQRFATLRREDTTLVAWPAQDALDAVRLVLDAAPERAPTLEGLAARFGLTPSALSRGFRQRFGVPPKRYLLQRRLEKADRLTAGTNLPLTEIALECGFSSHARMTEHYRRAFGRTPSLSRGERR